MHLGCTISFVNPVSDASPSAAKKLILRSTSLLRLVGRSPALLAVMNSEGCLQNQNEHEGLVSAASTSAFTEQSFAPAETSVDDHGSDTSYDRQGEDSDSNKDSSCPGPGPATQRTGRSADPPDEVLVKKARAGDGQAFEELIKRHWSTCLKRATLLLRNRTDAEDEVQNAFWKALQRIDQFRGDGSFSAWLNRIVENQCLMRIREDQNARFVYLDESTDNNVRVELVSQRADPEDALGLSEVLVVLRREIQRMPPLLRNVMLLRDLDQLPMPDVANRLGLSVPAAKSRLMRARAELRARVTKHCGRKGAGTLTQVAKYEQSAYTRAH